MINEKSWRLKMCLLIIYDSGYLMVFLYHTGKLKAFLKAVQKYYHDINA